MGNSKYPERFGKALKAIEAIKKTVDKDSKTFKTMGKALGDGAAIANNLPRDYKNVYDQQTSQMETFGKAAAMIQEYEEQLAGAGGDSKREKELKTKIKAEEKKCEACIKTLNDLRGIYSQLRGLAQTQLISASAEFQKLDASL